MTLNKLYDIADRENISVINFKMKNKAIIERIDKRYYIGLNYSKLDNSREEKEILAEELGHYYYDALYNTTSDNIEIQQKEYRANKWKCSVLVSVNELKKAIKKGNYTLYEIAEELCVSEETIKFAYDYYKENSYI